jgi:hypothetical protein
MGEALQFSPLRIAKFLRCEISRDWYNVQSPVGPGVVPAASFLTALFL